MVDLFYQVNQTRNFLGTQDLAITIQQWEKEDSIMTTSQISSL